MLKPLDDYMLIRVLEDDGVRKSGIIIPDVAKEKPQRGEVIRLGDNVTAKVKEHDIVLYKKWGGTEARVDGIEHLLVKEEDVLAVFVGEAGC